MIDIILRGLLRIGVGRFMRDIEPPKPDELVIDYNDPESVLFAASVFDHHGEWDRALSLYENVLKSWPDEHGNYARNCIKGIQAKIDLA